MMRDARAPGLDVEARPEVLDDDQVAGRPRQADQLFEQLERHFVAGTLGRGLHRLEHHLLGVHQQAVHVEDDRLDDARKSHASPCLRSSRVEAGQSTTN
jgi:hypothetical protein